MTIVLCWVALAFSWAAAQTTAGLPAFEAVSIKPNESHEDGSSWHSKTGYLVVKNQTLRRLVAIANRFPDDRVSGGPKWADSQRFDIDARAAGPAKDSDLLLMLQRTLAERFQVVTHRENINIDGYSLVPIKNGLKIPPDAPSDDKSKSNSTRGKIVAERITMTKLAETLARMLGKPVVDATGVTGVYTFKLEWTPDPPRPVAADAGAPEPPTGPTLFDVVASQLGLKLQDKKFAAEVLVIDKAERPTEN
jgi:uncharacterized protein (TIGR03435 family)